VSLATVGHLDVAVDAFDWATLQLGDGLAGMDAPMRVRAPIGDLAADVSEACRYILRPAVLETLGEWTRDSARLSRAWQPIQEALAAGVDLPGEEWARISEEQSERERLLEVTRGVPPSSGGSYPASSRRLRVAFKSVYFFVRAYQDALYRAALFVVDGEVAGGGARMARALRPDSSVGAYLQSAAPGYLTWFAEWRDQRNRVKDGVNFSTFIQGNDLGISFSTYTSEGGISTDASSGVGALDVAAALAAATVATDAIAARASMSE
jgi:hypothetical protein